MYNNRKTTLGRISCVREEKNQWRVFFFLKVPGRNDELILDSHNWPTVRNFVFHCNAVPGSKRIDDLKRFSIFKKNPVVSNIREQRYFRKRSAVPNRFACIRFGTRQFAVADGFFSKRFSRRNAADESRKMSRFRGNSDVRKYDKKNNNNNPTE